MPIIVVRICIRCLYTRRYMAFRHTGEGKNVFISVDNRSVTFNPLHNAWKAKSFTDKDIVLHFCILDILADGTARGVTEIIISDENTASCLPLSL